MNNGENSILRHIFPVCNEIRDNSLIHYAVIILMMLSTSI